MGGTSRSIREATDDDLPAIREILAAHGNDGAIVVADVVGPYLRHLIAHGRARVAVEGDSVVGFGATVDAGASVHLADLFVRADRLGQGIGRPFFGPPALAPLCAVCVARRAAHAGPRRARLVRSS